MNTNLPDNNDQRQKDLNELQKLQDELEQYEAKQKGDIPFPSVPSKHDGTEPAESLPQEAPVSTQTPEPSIESLEADIARDFGETPLEEEVPEPEPQADTNSSLGIETTYYQDMSRAMGANDPKTMSELIEKAKFEKELKRVNSPFTSKNAKYFIGTIILLVLSVIGWLTFFEPKENVEFILNERVRSIVYSDQDLGIDTTALANFETREAMTALLDRDFETGTLSQLYYVSGDEFGNLRRMGVKDIFDKTESQTPDLLYNNIENNFMHGVYTTDRNYPFIILKALSYDRAFEGMKQWEPTMVDDLASYFNLPDEARDRSLVEDGFSDDVISNKNVRVARYIPRANDRGGILDFIRSDGSEFEQEPQEAPQVEDNESMAQLISNFLTRPFITPRVHAQVGGSFLTESIDSNSASQRLCYPAVKRCIDLLTGTELPGTTTSSSTVACYDELVDPQTGQFYGEAKTPQEVGDDPQYVCKDYLTGGQSLGFEDLAYTGDVCFDPVFGQRISEEDLDIEPYALCFQSYQCNRIQCRQGDRVVSRELEGEPGVSCGLGPEVPLDFEGEKSCRQFNDLLRLQSLNNMNLCFDQNGNAVGSDSGGIEDFYSQNAELNQQFLQERARQSGVQCISPISRNKRYCINNNDQVIYGYRVNADGDEIPIADSDPSIKICFDAQDTESIGDQFDRGLNGEIRERLAQFGTRLRVIAGIVRFLGQQELANNVNEAADVFIQLAFIDVLQDENIRFVVGVLQDLERIIKSLPPQIQNNEVVQELTNIIDIVKRALGLENNVTWVTIGNNLPIGQDIYPGDNNTSGIESIQQALVEMGLLDPLSVTGDLDLVTQQGLQSFLNANGDLTGPDGPLDQVFISAEMINLIQQMVETAGNLFGGDSATINDFFTTQMGLGSFSEEVRNLQMILFNLGYDISAFDGIFDQEVCEAVSQYQADQGLEVADPNECVLSLDTIDQLNTTIRENNFLGSGYTVDAGGNLEGNGEFLGTFGPGSVSYVVNQAEANSLREGDIILMYTFIDEETILITRHESIIREIIQRRANEGIFN